MLSFTEIRKLNRSGNIIPLYTRIPADLDTPVSVYMRLMGRNRDAFLLESIEGGEKLARYSFLGFDPFLVVEGEGNRIRLKQKGRATTLKANPLEFLREMFDVYKPVKLEGLPRFTGGAVGYFSYDCVRQVEHIPNDNPDTIGLPQLRFGFFREVIVFDHLKQEIVIIANILHDRGQSGLKEKYDNAVKVLEDTVARLGLNRRTKRLSKIENSKPLALYSREEFEKMVRRVKIFIKEGDVYQVVLSQRWQVDSNDSSLAVYRRLRRLNPSSYMFLLNFGNHAVIGSSPEMLVRIEKGTIETRSIAGTRPRGKNEKEDLSIIRELCADLNVLADHSLLLDSARNDIGRVSQPGTVEVIQKMAVEKYSNEFHLMSAVGGRLRRNTGALDGHFACFPAGTVSGVPKIRAMEIIDNLEKERRSVYAGSIAYLDFSGNMDSCALIETIVKKGKRFYAQAGAAIGFDSKPNREYRDTEAKAAILIEAITGGNDR
ncbi:MAG TPA: chorismate-binding protein [candidate division Zixibacteria bacterium]|nr:chorismate-binding protein [candidate division Zixibacteria bacterium]